MTTNAELIARARELDAAATPGPWRAGIHAPYAVFIDSQASGPRHLICAPPSAAGAMADIRHAAESRTLLGMLATSLEASEARARAAETELAIRGEQLVRSENERQALADWAKEGGPVVSGVRRLQSAHSPRAHNDALTDLEVIPLPKALP